MKVFACWAGIMILHEQDISWLDESVQTRIFSEAQRRM
jgi:hypothetical protein